MVYLHDYIQVLSTVFIYQHFLLYLFITYLHITHTAYICITYTPYITYHTHIAYISHTHHIYTQHTLHVTHTPHTLCITYTLYILHTHHTLHMNHCSKLYNQINVTASGVWGCDCWYEPFTGEKTEALSNFLKVHSQYMAELELNSRSDSRNCALTVVS